MSLRTRSRGPRPISLTVRIWLLPGTHAASERLVWPAAAPSCSDPREVLLCVGLEMENPDRPEATNLLSIYMLTTGKSKDEVMQECGGMRRAPKIIGHDSPSAWIAAG